MAIEIRPLSGLEFAAWSPLWQAYLTFYQSTISDDVTKTSFSRLTGDNPAMGACLAWQGQKAVGMVNWIMHPSTWTAGDYCYLQDLFVSPDVRGGGIGRQLIDAVYDIARERSASRVYWLTHETNTDAMKLYDKVAARSGFVQYRKVF
ncbi:MAG: GNAT family N-acetyltransferase [Bosea sp. (in: a-proteobacteria)]